VQYCWHKRQQAAAQKQQTTIGLYSMPASKRRKTIILCDAPLAKVSKQQRESKNLPKNEDHIRVGDYMGEIL